MGLTCGIYYYVDIRSVFFYQSIIHVLEGAYFVRESPEKKLLIHNNINYYCEHFVCNLGSAAYVFEKKNLSTRPQSSLPIKNYVNRFFVKSNNICVVVKQGF